LFWRKVVTKKKQSSKVPLAQFIAIIVLSISVFFIIDFARRAAANYRVQREAERLTQEVETAQQQQEKLLARRSYVAGNAYIEEVARKELKWAKPGETVMVVLPTPEAVSSAAARATPAESIGRAARTPTEAWWLLFFGDSSASYAKATP
jgi:cell division protein FtsB